MKKLIIILIFTLLSFNNLNSDENIENKKYIFTDNIKIEIIDNNPRNIKILTDFKYIPKREFEYYKISHSLTNPKIAYPDGMIWYSDDINNNIALDLQYNFELTTSNYYRACIVTKSNIYCSKSDFKYIPSFFVKEEKNLDRLAEIKTFLRDNYKALDYIEKNIDIKNIFQLKEFNKESLAIILNNYDNEKLDLLKKKIIRLNQDIKIKENLNKINTLFDIENNIDQIERSIDIIGEYKLNIEILEKLEEKRNIIKNESSIKEDFYNRDEIINESEKIIKNIDYYRNTSFNKIDNISNYVEELNPSKDYNTVNNNLEQINVLIKENISKNEELLKDKDISEEEKNQLKIDNEKLKEQQIQIEKLKAQNNSIIGSNIFLIIFIFILFLLLGGYFYYNRLKNIGNKKNYKVLQIIKNGNEYSIEYDGIYNKGLKVLENTKKSLTKSIDNFVYATNKMLISRGMLDNLEKIDIEVPDLKSLGGSIYRLFITDNISNKLLLNKDCLIIKTDEQELPWEIMHDQEDFLSLKYPIARQIMTRESIKNNAKEINKKPKILFIVNPTLDLPGTEIELELITRKLGKKADIKILIGKKANIVNIIGEFGKNDYDIIHYSGHAFFDSKNPDESGLVLNNKDILSNTEIKRLLKGKPLIFLNACSSGKTLSDEIEYYNITGEDTIGLASSFFIGGASGVISTMWPISDNMAGFFSVEFYKNFLYKKDVGFSLLNAKKQTYFKNQKDPTWASFVYYGDPNIKINLK